CSSDLASGNTGFGPVGGPGAAPGTSAAARGRSPCGGRGARRPGGRRRGRRSSRSPAGAWVGGAAARRRPVLDGGQHRAARLGAAAARASVSAAPGARSALVDRGDARGDQALRAVTGELVFEGVVPAVGGQEGRFRGTGGQGVGTLYVKRGPGAHAPPHGD